MAVSLVQIQTSLGNLFPFIEPPIPSKIQDFHSKLYQPLNLFLLSVPPSHSKRNKVSFQGTEALAGLRCVLVGALHLNLPWEESCLVLGFFVCFCFLQLILQN